MALTDLANKLCRDMVHSVGHRHNRGFITTTFRYPDGDFVALYPEGIGENTYITDKGQTLFKCVVNRIPMSESREDLIDGICKRYDVVLQGGEFRKRVDLDRFGFHCLRFCEALTRVSNLQMDGDAKDRSTFSARVAALIERDVAPVRQVYHRWTDPQLDPKGDYPVDYRVNAEGPARNIFAVGSGGKSTLVSAVSSFLKLHDTYVPTMSIVDPDIQLGTHHLNRLQRASTEIRFGVTGYEQDIVNFALSAK